MLECRSLSVSYGQHRALEGASLHVAPGEIVVILGANGAGKTSLLSAIAGMVPPGPGSQVLVDGHAVTGQPPQRIVEAGVALVPEGRRIFGDLTVEENLLLGAYARRARPTERAHLESVFSLFPKLAERRQQIARTMSGGEQQMVAIGRALMSAPSILMLDEPSLGLSPLLCAELFRALVQVRQTGVGILLVEQNAQQALAIADRGYLLETGRIVGEDTAAALAQDTAVQDAYLGGGPTVPVAPTPAETTTAAPRAVSGAAEGAIAPTVDPGAPTRPADTATLPYIVARHDTGSSIRANADTLIGSSIADLVARAADRSADDVQGRRMPPAGVSAHQAARREPNRSATASTAPTAGGDTLQAALAAVEAAAARARRPVPSPDVETSHAPGSPQSEQPEGTASGRMT